MANLEDKQFAFSYWYVNNREQLKRVLILFLIVVNFVLAAFIIYSLINNFILNYKSYQQLQASFINDPIKMDEVINKSLPSNLSINEMKVFPTADNKGDILASVQNPNARWGATFNYTFKLAAGNSQIRSGFIFPGETKKIIDLAVPGGGDASNLEFSSINWIRENNFSALYNEKVNFDIKDVQFVPSTELNIPGKLPISRVTFKVANLSAYNYKNPSFLVLLYRSEDIIGVNYITAEKIMSGQTLDLEVNWFENLGTVNRVEIVPDINILNPDIFIKN